MVAFLTTASRCALLLLIAQVFFQSEASACADGVTCVVVKESADGFTALRSEPTPQSTMMGKLRPYEILVILSSDCRPHRSDDPWHEVMCVPRIDGDCEQAKPQQKRWVKSALVAQATCPTDMNK